MLRPRGLDVTEAKLFSLGLVVPGLGLIHCGLGLGLNLSGLGLGLVPT